MKNNLIEIIALIKKFELYDGDWSKDIHDTEFLTSHIEYHQNNGKNYIFISMDINNLEEMLIYAERKSREKNYKPQDTYAIFIYRVNEINEETYRQAISIEENEFVFKKYVFYYTEQEFNLYCSKKDRIQFDDNIWRSNWIEDITNIISKFILRLVIKVPIIKLNFSPRKLDSYKDILKNEITLNKIENSTIEELENLIEEQLEINNRDVGQVANSLLEKLLKE
ncbi:ABC-three component system middle component 1 [Listeria booriae]|uniref:ABC-three component system middle component 1 n=1 Tax=Listeria booriae TaxID=1552123 RepID=UPI001627B6D8|nr:ABC-three component system middle component 1 [Listeria booriae]MBC2196607.1 hypothetical protein [Listeria booriae]